MAKQKPSGKPSNVGGTVKRSESGVIKGQVPTSRTPTSPPPKKSK
ncbi:hypothetical protein SAMN05421640_3017 [Ekhidna lutea]|uniref:Uncharacterized protein n=1 Tax=Ekhidna lutea TaxID=447679 RepID=A0A239L8Y0_EKHLU|nr:hypothetical protein [Ekhidna lutea]SNT26119.1 hypothetical protein SAMN05421640_3017 [Ekhidna lutea]